MFRSSPEKLIVFQGKYQVPIPTVKAVSDAEAFKVVKTGKTRRKGWKRMVTKVTFVGESFTRKPAKFERFIRPMGLRFKKVNFPHHSEFEISPGHIFYCEEKLFIGRLLKKNISEEKIIILMPIFSLLFF